MRFRELRDADLRASRAWAIKEMFRHFWSYRYEGSAEGFSENGSAGPLAHASNPSLRLPA